MKFSHLLARALLASLVILGPLSLLANIETRAAAATANLQSEFLVQYNIDHLDTLASFQAIPTDTPELYSLIISWPTLPKNSQVLLSGDGRTIGTDSVLGTRSVLVTHHQLLKFEFKVVDESGSVLRRFETSVTIPQDFVVRRGHSDLSDLSKLQVARLFLNPEIPLITGGKDIDIDANLLVTNGGTIETLPTETQSISDKARSGGKITIHAEQAIGVLTVILRGEMGKNGIAGAPWSGPRAADGGAPSNGNCYTFSVGITQHQVTHCRNGNPGGSGSPGAAGAKGGDSGNGGDSGDLDLFVGNSIQFTPEIVFEPGKAGAPGVGGSGQPGGIAQSGQGANLGPRGSDGAQGSAGAPGAVGMPGKKGKSCQAYADKQTLSCDQ